MIPPLWRFFSPAIPVELGRWTALSERSCGENCRCGQQRRGFTLIELLVTMVLLLMLSTLTAVSLKGVGGSAALTLGGNRLVGLVNQARQNSMSKNVMTALILVTGQATPTQGDYRVVTLLEYNAANPNPAWKQISRWENLPAGVVIDNNPSDSTILSGNTHAAPASAPLPSTLPVKYRGAAISNYAARVFLPNGGLFNPSASAKIQLVEGAVQGNGVTYTHPKSAGSAANYYCIAIIGITGRSKIERP